MTDSCLAEFHGRQETKVSYSSTIVDYLSSASSPIHHAQYLPLDYTGILASSTFPIDIMKIRLG